MSYKIALRDKTELIVPDAAGKALMEHMLTLKKPANLEIAGEMYNSGQIVSVTKANMDPAGQSRAPQIEAPRHHCVEAGTSIQVLVRQQIKQQHPYDWPKFLKDALHRDKVRKAIRAKYPDRKFCDHHASEHACQDFKAVVA